MSGPWWIGDRAAGHAPGATLSGSGGLAAALTVPPDPVRIATEGALWGAIQAHGLLPETVIVSDNAGQFAIGLQGLC